ncbi:hypothetical protein OHB35_15065 [Streptomyces phaeochromogenes]|uniref:Uncharacterized protein n=1 Tax=Streptomyces phaeochromogenes TaxID=1923 RepID=A0ABZ1H8I9_STRPH|nr:hypothetical protein [Streptomyces phaeochromogenes]WSD14454.1 hypothetical protein OHB35_15065 [Streptomyces phaeochromogenes]
MIDVPTDEAVAAGHVETQADTEADSVVRVRVDWHAPAGVHPPKTEGTWHLLAPADRSLIAPEPVAQSASVVVADARKHPNWQAAQEELRERVRSLPGALVVAAVTSSRSALVWVRVQPPAVWEPAGYTVTVRSDEPGPVGLYPSVIYGWIRWWADQQTRFPPGFPFGLLMPRPPGRIDATLLSDTYRLAITPADALFTSVVRDPQDPAEWR